VVATPAPSPSPSESGDIPRAPARAVSPDSTGDERPPHSKGDERPPGAGTAADAREALKKSRPYTGAKAAAAPAGPRSAPKRGEATARREAAPPPADVPTAAPKAAVPTGALPSRDEVVLAWGDSVLASLPARAKSRFSPGRFLDVAPDAIVFGLPNKIHAAKCEEVRGEVEAALSAHFGVATPLRIVIDDAPPPPPSSRRDGSAATSEPDVVDEVIDVTDLADATDAPSAGVDVVHQIFPGAEVIDGE
jgi:hypothetical protein